MGSEVSVVSFREVVDGLTVQARNGKTARVLVDAAEAEFRRIREDERDEARARHAELTAEVAELSEAVRSAAEEREFLSRRLARVVGERDGLRTEVAELRSVPVDMRSEDGSLSFSFSPRHRTATAGLWRLDELESVLSHLRVSGAEDGTAVRMTDESLDAEMAADGFVPEVFSLPSREVPSRGGWSRGWVFAVGGAVGLVWGQVVGLLVGAV